MIEVARLGFESAWRCSGGYVRDGCKDDVDADISRKEVLVLDTA